MTRDRLQYEVFYYLWNIWHCRLPRFKFFMRKVETIGLARDRYGNLYNPIAYERRHWVAVCGAARPWWHMCCNGDAGGWRTQVCDYLEHKWRYTQHYKER
jgi:hypothetical protein